MITYYQVTGGIIKHDMVRNAMLGTDRALYAPPQPIGGRKSTTYNYGPYADAPQLIGHKVDKVYPGLCVSNLNCR